jgi:KDO2-lipid IV(A) lauroyltransferase
MRNLGRLMAEFCHLHEINKDNIMERVRFANPEQWNALVSQFRETGALILTGHFGNWELLAYAHAYYGFPVHIVHRRLQNPLIDDAIVRERERCGNKVIRKTTAGIEVFRAIKQKAIVVAAVDQNASGRMGVFVPFFSRLASTSSGLAGLALASGVPVIPAVLVRENGLWNHRIEILPPVEPIRTGDQETDLRETTARFTAVFEEFVRQYPTTGFGSTNAGNGGQKGKRRCTKGERQASSCVTKALQKSTFCNSTSDDPSNSRTVCSLYSFS